MSQTCAAPKCERISRGSCDCCNQILCLQHLHEHNEILVSKLNPLIDEINALGDRLNRINIQQMTVECHQKLEQWRQDCHKKIDHFFEKECYKLDQIIALKKEEQ
jgi:replication fork clamp-binding protein CrfC